MSSLRELSLSNLYATKPLKNGKQVDIWFDITASSDLAETNYYTVTGLPFVPQYNLNGAGQVATTSNSANSNQKTVHAVDVTTTSGLKVRVSPDANFNNSDNFSGKVSYITS